MAKGFTWTYSKLKNVDDCGFRHYQVDILKNYSDGGGESLEWGNYVHEKLAASCGDKQDPLPLELTDCAKWVDRTKRWRDTGFTILVEQKMALTKAFGPTSFFAHNVWMRAIADVVAIKGPIAIAVDWKTGKVLDDPVQLGLVAACVFAKFPEVQRVAGEYVWLKEDTTTGETFTRSSLAYLWQKLLPKIQEYERKCANPHDFIPRPGGLCKKYCPVKKCEFHGKGTR